MEEWFQGAILPFDSYKEHADLVGGGPVDGRYDQRALQKPILSSAAPAHLIHSAIPCPQKQS